jgi:hypothetical protein
MANAQRSKHDRAYACYLPLGIASVLLYMVNETRNVDLFFWTAFLVIVPLAIVSLVLVPIGIHLSAVLWRDPLLLFLATLTILMVLYTTMLATTEVDLEFPYLDGEQIVLGYGFLVLAVEITWFVIVRRLVYRHDHVPPA